MRLIPMTEAHFDAWTESAVKEYAEDKVKAGTWRADDALERSRGAFREQLPDGVRTEGHHLFSLEDEVVGRNVGILWVAVKEGEGAPRAFVYDIAIDEAERGKGYGTQAMLALEDRVRALGLDTIGLHVFGHNPIARDLYLKVGYEVTDYVMAKNLGDA